MKQNLKEIALILAGVMLATLGLKGFLLPNEFLDGGVTGISLLLRSFTGLNLSILILAINIPFIIIGRKQISLEFAIKSACAIILLAIALYVVEIPAITHDKLLIAVFGGFFLGCGIGFAIRGGSVIDGTEVLAIYVSRHSGLTVGDFITIFNTILFLVAAFVVSVEVTMYSMLTYFSASRAVDFMVIGIEEYIGLTIISEHSAKIKDTLMNELKRGVTVYKSESGFGTRGHSTHDDRRVLFCVATRLEVSTLLEAIDKIDPKAFVVQQSVRETKGGMIKRRPLH